MMRDPKDPVLEYRRYIQKQRSADDKRLKLKDLSSAWGTTPASILYEFLRGDDLPDPYICDREAIEKFAKKYHVENDPQVVALLTIARPLAEFVKL